MLFQLKRKSTNRVVKVDGQSLFNTYEEARQAARRKIREMVRAGEVSNEYKTTGFFDSISRGPTKITGLFKIVQTNKL